MSHQPVIEGLNDLVADAAVFFYKLHNYHWNVKGPQFFKLHEVYEEMYTETAGRLDELAERILAAGGRPITTLAAALDRAGIAEDAETPDTRTMVRRTLDDLTTQRERMQAVSELAQSAGDKTTENTLDEYIDSFAKRMWMFAAFLEESVEAS